MVPERQERRWKVQRGREVHSERAKVNQSYLRKKLHVVGRQFDVPLSSDGLRVRGIADEVLTFEDGSMGPFDYKFAKAPKTPYRNQVMQCVLYGMLIEEIFLKPVCRGYLCYTRSNHQVVEVAIDQRLRARALKAVADVIEVIQRGHLPLATGCKARCVDCCYRNICIQ